MPGSDTLDKGLEFITSESSAIFDLSVLKNEFLQKIRKHIVNSYPNVLQLDSLFDQQLTSVNEIYYDNENLSSGNVPVSQPLGIIIDNIFNENDKDENKIDKIMRKLEEYYLLPVESENFQDLALDEPSNDDPPAIKAIDNLVLPNSLKIVDGFNWMKREQAIYNTFPVLNDRDPEQQITVLVKIIVHKIHELKTKADAICCEYGIEIPTAYGKLLSYILGFFNYLPTLPCIIQMASFTIFKDLPVYFQKAISPRRWLIIAPTSSRALKETIIELNPIYYVPDETTRLDNFKSGIVVYFYNQTFEIEELLKYRWDCTMIFGEAKERKPTDKAYDMLSKLEMYQKERFGFTIIMFEKSENLWTKAVSPEFSYSFYKWFFPTFYEVSFIDQSDLALIITEHLSSLIPHDEKQLSSGWLLKVLDLLVYKANNDQIFPFMLLYNEAALNVLYEKITKVIGQIKKLCNYTTLDNINVIFMNEEESSKAAHSFSSNGIPYCFGEDTPGKLRLFVISEVYNIEAMNVFVFAHFSPELAGKICAVMRKPSKYDKTIWFLQPKNQPVDMETFSTYFEVCREPFLNEEGRKTCMDESSVLSKLKKEKIKDLPASKKLYRLSTVFTQELKTDAGGSERYANKFRKFLHIYQNARKQLEAELRQKENDAYQHDTEMEPPTPTSKQPRQTKKKPAPLKTQQSRQSIPKKAPNEQPRITYQSVHDKIRSYLPPSVGASNRLPFTPLQRSIIKKIVHEKQRLGPLDPIVEFNLCTAALKFQLFGNYYRNIEKNNEYYRAASHLFNWDAFCIYFNYFSNSSNDYTNKLNLNKKFFSRFFRKTLIYRTVCVDTNAIINRRQYEREFRDYLGQNDDKPSLLSFNYRSLFERCRHHSQPISTAGISESTFDTLGKELAVAYENDYYYTDLIDIVQSSHTNLLLPEDSFTDMLRTDFDLLLLNDVSKKMVYNVPFEEFDDNNNEDLRNFDYNKMFVPDYLSGHENLEKQSSGVRINSFSNMSKIPASCQTILDYGDYIVDEPISPTEPSECDNIKEEISYSKSLDAMDTGIEAADAFIGIGPTRRKIKIPENVQNYNLSSELMPIRVSPFRKFDENPLPMLFGSSLDDNDADNESEYGSAMSSDEENLDLNERKRKAVHDEDESEFLADAKRRKVLDESGSIGYESTGNVNNESVILPPKFHLSPSEDSNSQNFSTLQIMPIEDEINFAVFYLLKEKANNYLKTCLPYLNSLDNNSKLSILQHSSRGNIIKADGLERSFYEQPLLRKAFSNSFDQKETYIKDVFEELVNLNGIFSRDCFDDKEIAQQTSKKFSISFNDLMLRQYYERAIPITLSSQRYSYGDTSVMPAKIQSIRRLNISQQTPPAVVHNQPRIISPMTPGVSRASTPNVYRSPQPNAIPEHQQQLQSPVISQQPYQRVVPANFSQPRQIYSQQHPMTGMLTPPHHQPMAENAGVRPSTPQNQALVRQPMQQPGTPNVPMIQSQPLGRPLTFPYEYHSNFQDKCECANKDLGQPLYYNDEIPNYDDETIDPLVQLQKIYESTSSDSSLTLLYLLCQSVPFFDSKLKDNQETNKLLADNTITEFTPPIIPPLSLARSNCLQKSRERFKSRQQIYVTLRGLGKTDIMNLLKQYEMKFNFPFNDFFNLKYRRSPAYDVRYLLNLWRTMSLSNKLRRVLKSHVDDPKKKFLQSMAPRTPLERSAEVENIENGLNKIILKRSASLPNLNENKELQSSQIVHIKNGFKKAITRCSQKFPTFKFNQERVIVQPSKNVPEISVAIQKRHQRTYHLGISKMSLTINKRKVSTISRFYRTRRHQNPRKILPLYRRWKKPFHVEEYWKYTKDKREPPQAMFDINLNQFI